MAKQLRRFELFGISSCQLFFDTVDLEHSALAVLCLKASDSSLINNL